MFLPDELGYRQAPYTEFSLRDPGAGAELRDTQTPLSGNIAQNPGRELGRERWGAGGGGEGDLIVVTGLGPSVLPGFQSEQSGARGASGVRSKAWHRQCLGSSDICRLPASTAVLPGRDPQGVRRPVSGAPRLGNSDFQPSSSRGTQELIIKILWHTKTCFYPSDEIIGIILIPSRRTAICCAGSCLFCFCGLLLFF